MNLAICIFIILRRFDDLYQPDVDNSGIESFSRFLIANPYPVAEKAII